MLKRVDQQNSHFIISLWILTFWETDHKISHFSRRLWLSPTSSNVQLLHGRRRRYGRHASCRTTFERGTGRQGFAVPYFSKNILKHQWFSLVNLTKFGPYVMAKRFFLQLTSFNMFMAWLTWLRPSSYFLEISTAKFMCYDCFKVFHYITG